MLRHNCGKNDTIYPKPQSLRLKVCYHNRVITFLKNGFNWCRGPIDAYTQGHHTQYVRLAYPRRGQRSIQKVVKQTSPDLDSWV